MRSAGTRLRHSAAAALFVSIWIVMLVFGRGPIDGSIYQALYAGRHPALVMIARIFTGLGEPTVLVIGGFAVGAWLWRAGRGRFGIALLVVILIGRALTEVQKYWVARPRPDLQTHLVLVQTSSFPSGHATSSMIFYLTLALALTSSTRWRRIAAAGAILLSILIGVSRVMLGVHWPSDVIGGWSFGLLWVLVTLRPAERLFAAHSATTAKQL